MTLTQEQGLPLLQRFQFHRVTAFYNLLKEFLSGPQRIMGIEKVRSGRFDKIWIAEKGKKKSSHTKSCIRCTCQALLVSGPSELERYVIVTSVFVLWHNDMARFSFFFFFSHQLLYCI